MAMLLAIFKEFDEVITSHNTSRHNTVKTHFGYFKSEIKTFLIQFISYKFKKT